MGPKRLVLASYTTISSDAMAARLWKALVLFVTTGLLGLGLVGCDSVGLNAQTTALNSNEAPESESLFQLTNDLASRMTARSKSVMMNRFGGGTARTAGVSAKAASSVSLTSIAQVDPPGDTTRASHLTYHSGTIYAGYKALGPAFKGGIDILDANDPTNILDVNSLGSDGVDVQEVAYDEDENALYVAAAADPSTFVGENPSLLTKVTNFNDPNTSSVGLTGQVGKSVVNAPDGDQEHDLYVVTDEETLYRFDTSLGNEKTEEVQGVEFRSVATTSDDIFTVDRGARVYSSSVQSTSGLTEEKSIGSGVGDLAIGRLHVRNEPVLNGDRLFLALGSEGIAVLDANSSDILFRRTGPYYTSLTLHHDDPDVANAPTDFVYGARPNGILDVYRVSSNGVDEGDQNVGLEEVGTFDLSELDGVDFGTSPQVNQVMGVGCNVYVANSNEGVVALEIGGIQGCGGAGGNQAPSVSDDSDQTTEGQSTTTDVLSNDSDPDGSLDASTVTVQSNPSNGTITNIDGSTGEVTYEPDAGFTGDDTYTYTVKDDDGAESNEATVTVTVNAPSPPTPPANNPKAISFAAFCTTQGSFDTDDVTIVEVLNKNNNPNEPVSIAWTSTTGLSTVVLKAGNNMSNHSGGTSGGAASSGGTSVGNDQSPPSPCPNGENLIIKDEDVGDNSGADS